MTSTVSQTAAESHLAGLAPCAFPALWSSNRTKKRPMTVRVNLEQSSELWNRLSSGDDSLLGSLRAAWAVLLQLYTSSEDICFGYQETASLSEGDDKMDMPVVRLSVGNGTTLAQMVERAKCECAEKRSISPGTFGRPPFNTVLEFRDSSSRGTGNCSISTPRPLNVVLPEYCRLRLLAKKTSSSLNFFLEGWTSDMTMEQTADVASTFDKILSNILTRPSSSVGELDCLPDRHINEIHKFNGSPLNKVDRCIHEIIQAQVLQKPNSEAICAWDGSLTFQELDHLSSRLASRLVELGVGPEVRVPLCFDKSKWNIVAMIAVSKAGGAFVPLDPSHPIQRIQDIAHDVEASLLLCSRHHASILAPVVKAVVPVDSDWINAIPAGPEITNNVSRCKPTNAAYIIFTSGSTGSPKGTVVEHSAYCSSAAAHAPRLHINSSSRVLQFAAHTFDSSLVESLTSLMQGACVCIPSEEQRLNAIVSAINGMRVNLATLTPSFVEVIEPSAVPDLQTLVLAGEAMSESQVAVWSKINLVNGYGPTESSVSAVINSKVTADTDPKDIGFPVGIHCWVVNPDDHDRLVPLGCTGELLLEGPTLARGYLNNAEKTKESFIYDPSWSQNFSPGTRRFYKTGDLVRYNSPEGSLSYVGRKDTQVKFHGQRIELGEIEHHINANPNIKHALVLLPKVGHYKGRLVSVLSLSENLEHIRIEHPSPMKLVETSVTDSYVEQIREGIAQRIPAYMVASAWLCVESLPMLSSGKLDRKTVAKWVEEISDDVSQQIPLAVDPADHSSETSTEVEEKLRRIWSRVLNLPVAKLGFHRSFLSVGGDSITAMTCVGFCKTAGLGFTVQEVLRSRSIKELAKLAKDVNHTVGYQEEVEKYFDLSPIQQFHFQKRDEEQGHFNQSFFLRLSRPIEEADLRRAIDALIDRHSMLRARFSPTGQNGQWKQRITADISSSYRFHSHKAYTPEQADPVIADSQTCLNAVHGPLSAIDLFVLNDGQLLLSIVAHHLVIDLVSWRVILEDLEELLLNPAKPSLAPKSLPFQAWQSMQQENAQQLSLTNVMPVENIPTGDLSYWGMVDQPNTYGDATCEGFELDTATTSLLLGECNVNLSTETVDVLVSVLLYSFSQVFTDRCVPAVYNEGHGREPWDESIDIARTVGWFTTIYPVFVAVSASDTLVVITKRVRDIRRRVPGNGRPYFASRFLTEHGMEQFGHHTPMEVAFNYLGQYQQLEREDALLLPVNEMAGEAREAGGTADFGQNTPRFGLFEISAVVVQGKLRYSFTFNRYMKHQKATRQWISQCQGALQRAAREFVSVEPVTAATDFPLLPLSDASLRTLINEKLPQIGVPPLDWIEDAYPCSPMQRGILLGRTKNKDLYSVRGTYEVKPKRSTSVDVKMLAAAWKRIVQRHQALRTVFIEGLTSDDVYGQVVLKEVDAEPVLLQCDSDSDVLKVFDAQGEPDFTTHRPPHRFIICETSSGKVFCRLEMSHAIMDGASISVIFRDLQSAYAGTLVEGSGPLYSDFVAYLLKQPQEPGLSFWKSYLKGVEPTHFPSLNDGATAKEEHRRLRVEYGSLPALQDFCGANGLTLPNAIHAAWGLTLRCYTGAGDVTFGYISSERDSPFSGADAAVGPLINILTCRVKISANMQLISALDELQKDFVDSLPHKHTSLADVQHALGLSDNPLFNTGISYRKLPRSHGFEEQAIEFPEHCPIHDPAEYPISLNIEATDSEAAIDMGYQANFFSDGQARNIANTFMKCLDDVAYNSHQQVGQLDLLSNRDRDQIWAWNSNVPEAVDDCVHRKIEQQVESHPLSPAVHAWDGQFSYRQLNDAAERLGHYLVALGVGPETLVPTCFDNSTYAIISMLAVLKAGGSCVPLDVAQSNSSVENRVFDSAAQVVLASVERSSVFEDMVLYVVSVNRDLLDQLPSYNDNPCPDVRPSNTSFVICESDISSQPNDVAFEHRAMVASGGAHASALSIDTQTRLLQHAPYNSNACLQMIFTTLQTGGCVCVPSDNDCSSNVADAINDLDANFVCLAPMMASSLHPSSVPTVKAVAVGGEVMTKEIRDIWGGSVALHRQYGWSGSLSTAIHNIASAGEDNSNIGYSVGSRSWIVDPTDHNRLVPVGCVGELLIEGPTLARGWFNDQENTSKDFIESPSWTSEDPSTRYTSNRRMYKTGDLVRYNSDGSMVYVGRRDTRVQMNGQWVDLRQIENHVSLKLPQNAQSAAQAVTIGGTKHLAVFLCLRPEDSVPTTRAGDIMLPATRATRSIVQSLKAATSDAVPNCSVPSMYIPVSRLPLTSTGNIDQAALKALAQTLSEEEARAYRSSNSGDITPSTESENVIRQLWSKILSKPVNAIGAEDNFFRLGGDSMGAIKLVAAAHSKGITLTVAKIFQKPKLSQMVADISVDLQSSSEPSGQAVAEGKGQQQIQPYSLLPQGTSVDELVHEVAAICQVDDASIEDMYPCTPIQGGLVALSSKTPGAYVAQTTFKLPSYVDFGKFREAWQGVADSEVVLRTRIVFTEELGFMQVVIKAPIEWESARHLGEISDESRRVPSHEGGELCRYTLVGEGTGDPHFVWTVHHALYDGWSMPILLNRVVASYKVAAIPAAPIAEASFPHFIQYLSSIDSKKSDEFWKSFLQSSSAVAFPQLPNPGHQCQPTSKLSNSILIPRDAVRETTLASVIRSSWALIVSLYSYSDDVIFGEIMNGRDAPVPGIGDMIGPTFTTVPVRVRVERDLTIGEYLRTVQNQMAEIMPYQFAGLQNIRRLGADAAGACEFQNCLAVTREADVSADGFWDVTTSSMDGTNFYTYPLTMACTVGQQTVNVEANYDPALISTWQVQKLVSQFETMIQRLASDESADVKIGDVSLVSSEDVEAIEDMNSSSLPTVDRCVHQTIQGRARSYPGSQAICSWDGTFTYRELDELSSTLAHHLINLGVGPDPETFVPLLFEKSAFTVISMLAVLKAGGAFVPFDPGHPPSRLREMASDLGASLALCSPKYGEVCDSIVPRTLPVDLNLLKSLPNNSYPTFSVPTSNAAYIVFTSGTTGTPKGTIVEHMAFASSASAFGPALLIKPTSRMLQFASYSFDASLIETLAVLMRGGCICVPSDLDRLNDITEFMNKFDVNIALLTPSFVNLISPDDVPGLETLILGGEAMSKSHVDTWAGNVNLVNAYGPSEASVVALVNNRMTMKSLPANIGQYLDKCWIVDAQNHHRLCPVGAVGELLVEGPTVARGYLNNPEKTSEVFIKDPKWASADAGTESRRLYKTGDLVKYSSDGSMDITFIGRKDTQTKVRGQRLELGEVELKLNSDRAIRNVLVTVPKDGPEAKKLVAVLSLRGFSSSNDSATGLEEIHSKDVTSETSRIRERLSRCLPAYMVPSRWIVLRRLPLLQSGKLDRKQIEGFVDKLGEPGPETTAPQITKSKPKHRVGREVDVDPNIDIPGELKKAWSHVLKLPIEDIDDASSFLHLGGDSISAMQVMARCRSRGIGVTSQDIIGSASVSELAKKTTFPKGITSEKAEDGKPFDLSPIQQVYLEHVDDKWRQFNQSMLMRLTKYIPPDTVRRAVEKLVAAHSMLRARFEKSNDGSWKQRISNDVSGSYRFRVHSTQSDQVEYLIEDSQKFLDIHRGPLIAFDLFALPESDRKLSIVAHHLVVDIVSWRTIVPDLENTLKDMPLRYQNTLPFQTWCQRQMGNAHNDHPHRVLPVSDIPEANYDYWAMTSRPNTFSDIMSKDLELDGRSTSELLKACRKFQLDPADILLASMLLSFRRVFSDRQPFPPVFNEGHGREPWKSDIDISSTVGWFTTLTPVLLPDDVDINRDDSFLNAVQYVRDFRSRTPDKGRSYFAYRTVTAAGKRHFGQHWPMEIVFNYLGQMKHDEPDDAILQEIDGGQSVNANSNIGPSVPRFAVIEISAIVQDNILKVSFSYNRYMKQIDEIRKWVHNTRSLLEDAPAYFERRDKATLTAKDFPLLPLTFGGAAKLAELLPSIGLSSLNEIECVHPCSPMQRGMLISQLKDPAKYSCNFTFEVRPSRSTQQVEVGRLEAAWRRVIQRHSALRTVFVDSISGHGLMDQVVLQQFPGWIVHRQSTAKDFQAILSDLEPLDCKAKVPPHRLTICKTTSGRIYTKLEISHTIADGSSIQILLKDLGKAYEQLEGFNTFGPPYHHYIAHLQTTSMEAGIAYWKNYLAGIEPCSFPPLPDSPRPRKRESSSYYLSLNCGAELQSFCMKQGLTAANVLQLAWGLVLRAYTGSNDVCFGYVASGRNVPVEGIEEAIGAFVNMLICRLSLSDNSSVSDVLQQTRTDWMRSMEYQNCSLADVQHELGLSDTSLFNTVFTYQRRDSHTVDEGELSFEPLDANDPTEFIMALNIDSTDNALGVNFCYSADTISNIQAENVAKSFEQTLCDLIQSHYADRTIGMIDLFGNHSTEVVGKFNIEQPKIFHKCVHEMIGERVRLGPCSAMAVHAWDASFTYTELDTVTSRLAAHLTGLGVGPEICVPILFEKSAWVVVAYLAILKAGGAFVPLDPAHPETRLRGLVGDVDANLVLCSRLHREKASRISTVAFTVDQKSVECLLDQPSAHPITSPGPTNAAYVIFTSGTTGKPKGTVIEHRAICTSAMAHSRALLMDSSSRVFQFASYTFDACIMEIVTALVVGACICIPSDDDRMNDIPAAISKFQATWMFLTPSVLSTLKMEKIPTMEVIAVGGEPVPIKILEEWIGGPAIVEAYGPTETTVVIAASVKVDRRGTLVDGNPSCIGTTAGCRSWIVDVNNCNKLAPVGAVGELILEGYTIARAYLNNPEKTAEAFIEDPGFTRESRLRTMFPHKFRMYRTGDLVRYNPDGSINYVSRRDNQIKLNGQRIEIGEIEYHCKAGLPDHTQAAVELVTPPDRPKIKNLAVYFDVPNYDTINGHMLTKADGSAADEILLPMTDAIWPMAKTLEMSLTTAVPSYMVPHIFIPVKELPTSTTSGKLDRNRIRTMTQELTSESIKSYRLTSSTSNRTAASGTAGKLQKLWERVLGLSSGSVGTEDSFFRLGGDSLAAMQLSGAARSQGITLTFPSIFRHPILQDMAKACGIAKVENPEELEPFSLLNGTVDVITNEVATLCGLDRQMVEDVYPPSTLQEGLIALSIKQPGAYIAQNVFRLSSKVDVDKFKAAWQTAFDDLSALRTRIVHTPSSNFLQVVVKPRPIEWESATTLRDLYSETSQLPAYNGGPLTKFTLVEERQSSSRFFILSIHHAIYDGWSLSLVLKRIESAYFGLSLSSPNVPYSRFIHYLTKRDAEESKQFWRTQLADVSATAFPHMPRSTTAEPSVNRTVRYKANISKASIGGDVTVPAVIRATWAMLVAAHTGTDDVCFGETLTGRNVNMAGITDIVGPTLTTVPTRVQVNHSLSVVEYLQNVHQIAADVTHHQHLGLQHIRRLSEDAAAACDFQNLLIIQTAEENFRGDLWELQIPDDSQNFFTYRLVVECRISKSHVEIAMHHKEDVLDNWHVRRLMGQFGWVLQQLIDGTNSQLKNLYEIDVFSAEDREVTEWWNRREAPMVDECIHDAFMRIAGSQPKAPAVCDKTTEISYEELHDYASRLAVHLTSLGVGPEDFVPICVNKSVWAVVAIMGVLISGGAFVPLDPSHPISRHREVIEDTEAKIAIASPNLADRFYHLDHVISIEGTVITGLASKQPRGMLPQHQSVSNAAYAIFTSGSTGRPKGVVIEHGAFSSSSAGMAHVLLMNTESRVLQFTSLSFDVAMLEILTTLAVGGCVCVPSEEERLSDIDGALRRMHVTWAALTPSVANIIKPDAVPSLEVLVCAGEALTPDVVSKWSEKVTLFNGYGPSESSVLATVKPKVSSTRNSSCIGVGLPSTLTWVLNSANHDKLAPLGAIGELALEGPTLARGYLKSPQRTTEVFIDCPSWGTNFSAGTSFGRRIYKTGDLVKYNPDGSLDFIGRKDSQVKLHGQRMELGEIERRLDTDRRIYNTIVLLPDRGPCKKLLVAITSLNNLTSNISDLSTSKFEVVDDDMLLKRARTELKGIRDRLSDRLPSFMIPQAWVVVKTIPMLASGKLDRKLAVKWIESMDYQTFEQIMELDEDGDDLRLTGVAKVVQEIWSTVLNLPLEKVKPNKSFLSLGGDSITAMTVMSRCREKNIILSFHDVLRSKSIADLVELTSSTATTTSQPETADEPFDLSPIQRLYFYSATSYTGESRFNQSFSLRVARPTTSDDLKCALVAVIKHHSMLRARFSQNKLGGWWQRITEDVEGSHRYRLHNLEHIHQIPPLVANSQRALDIENGPVLAVDYFNTRHDGEMIFLVAHHLCVDAVSWRIILQDLQEFLEHGTLTLDKPLSFQTWTTLHAEQVHSQDATASLPFEIKPSNLAYWGMEGSLNAYSDTELETFLVGKEITETALGNANKAFQTEPIDLFLSVISHSFGRVFSDREIPTIFNEGHGREPWQRGPDPSRTVGWFTTISPIHIPGDSSDDVLSTLRRTKDIRRSISDNGQSYLAKAFPPNQDPTNSAPNFPVEIIFNYLGRMQQFERDDSLFQPTNFVDNEQDSRAIGDVGAETVRFALFELSAVVLQGQIQFSFMFNRNMRHRRDMCRWVTECKRTLEETVKAMAYCSPEPTLSDYPLLPISYEGLRKLVKVTFPKVGVSGFHAIEDVYPCSSIQEGILLSQIRDPNAYLLSAIFEVKDKAGCGVDAERLATAWQQVVGRHPALRTVFIDSLCRGSTFDQVVVKKAESGIVLLHCYDWEAAEKLRGTKLIDNNYKKRPKLPHQLTICTTTTGRVLLKTEVNHAVIDGGSSAIIMRDLALAYENKLPGSPGPLYSDYIRFIRNQSSGKDVEFWKRYLCGVQPCHLPRLNSKKESGRQLSSVRVGFYQFSDLQDVCDRTEVTLANVIHAAWAMMLRIYTRSDDVCFGYLSAGRDAPVDGLQDAIGSFINMLCCRVQFTPSASFDTVFRTVQDDYIASLPYQRCSLAKVQHELGLAGKTLYNTVLSIQNHSRTSDAAEESLIFETQEGYDPSEYAVTVNVETTRKHEEIVLRYWSDFVSQDEAEKIAKSMAQVLASFATQRGRLVSEFYSFEENRPDHGPNAEVTSPPHSHQPSEYDSASGLPQNLYSQWQAQNNTINLEKMVDRSVREIIQQMIKTGSLFPGNGDENTHPMRKVMNENIGSPQPLGSEYSGLKRKEEVIVNCVGESLPGAPTTLENEPRQPAGCKPAIDTDCQSMASHIKRRGGSARVEKTLLAIWCSILEIAEDSIAREDSFFELGGDSLAAMKLVGAARDEGLALTVADVFRNPVFEDMVAMIRAAGIMSEYLEDHDKSDFNAHIDAMGSASDSELHQRFSLVKATNIDAFLQINICPKVGVFKGGISDVLPVTDFQALAITGSLLESRWMLNYFFFDGTGQVDLKKLKLTAFKLTQSIDIFRTVFLPCDDRFLQVVLRKMRPEFNVYETEVDLDEFTNTLHQRDRDAGPRLGEPLVRFGVVKLKGSDRHRILLRMSHAQYDGVCMTKITEALRAAYEHKPLPTVSSFAKYVRSSAGTITADHYDHWRFLLKGSRMTEIIHRNGPSYRRSAGTTSTLKQIILLPSIAQGSITTATVVKAAWALVLAQLSGKADVVFGHTISGRNATVPNVETTVGPCLNIVPVRVQFGADWTALDLLRHVQDQQVANMPYETLGFREIIKHCTEWPAWTNFTTAVQHQNVSFSPGTEMQIGGNTYQVGVTGAEESFTDISVLSNPLDSSKCEISLTFSLNGEITPVFAQKVLHMLCNTASDFVADPNTPLQSPEQLHNLPLQTVDEAPRPSDNYYQSSQLQGLSKADLQVLYDILRRMWQQVLGEENTHNVSLESSFFDRNGDIMGVAQLAWLLEQEGFKLRLEDLIDHPTMLGQIAAMCSARTPKTTSIAPVDEDGGPTRQTKKSISSWIKAIGLARRMVRRNTRGS